jgi:hypothetical protein
MRILLFFLPAAGLLMADLRPPLAFREDWKETPAALPITAEHVANPDLVLFHARTWERRNQEVASRPTRR